MDHIVKIKASEKIDKYLDLVRELKNCSWCLRISRK